MERLTAVVSADGGWCQLRTSRNPQSGMRWRQALFSANSSAVEQLSCGTARLRGGPGEAAWVSGRWHYSSVPTWWDRPPWCCSSTGDTQSVIDWQRTPPRQGEGGPVLEGSISVHMWTPNPHSVIGPNSTVLTGWNEAALTDGWRCYWGCSWSALIGWGKKASVLLVEWGVQELLYKGWPGALHPLGALLNRYIHSWGQQQVISYTFHGLKKPRHVPWLGKEPVTLWFMGRCSIYWATLARAVSFLFLAPFLFTLISKSHGVVQ